MSLHEYERIQARIEAVADPVGFLAKLFMHAPVGFAVWDAFGRALLSNKAFFDIFLVEPPPEYNVLDDELLAANGMLPLFQRAFRGETVHVPTFWYDPREHTQINVTQGRRVAVSMTIFPLLKENGEIDYVAATYKDETEVMLANERLRLREEDLRITLDSIGDGVIATDASGLVTRMNPAAEQLTGWSFVDAKGKGLAEVFRIVDESTRRVVESPAGRVLREGVVVGLANHTILISKDGAEHALANSGAPIRDRDGHIQGVVLVFRDETDQRKVDALRRDMNAVDAANKELEAFSYSVSHDLRAPLRAIHGFSKILRTDHGEKLDDEGRHCLDRVVATSERMASLIDDLLGLSRVTREHLFRQPVSLSDMVGVVVRDLRGREPSRDVVVDVEAGVHANADPRLTRIVLENLVGNAWKFTSKTAAPRIVFGKTEVDGEPVFFVRDNGAGFDQARATKLFSPFQRLHRHSDFEGTGIGLATVQRIVGRHGGRVWAESRENHGATFHFTLSPSTAELDATGRRPP